MFNGLLLVAVLSQPCPIQPYVNYVPTNYIQTYTNGTPTLYKDYGWSTGLTPIAVIPIVLPSVPVTPLIHRSTYDDPWDDYDLD